MLTLGVFGNRSETVAAVFLLAGLILLVPELRGQANPPLQLGDLEKALETTDGAMTSEEIITRIRENGVAFQMDADAKTAILISGAKGRRSTDEVLEIIREVEDNCATCPPLSKMDILGLAFTATSGERIERMVKWRRVAFECSPTDMHELQTAGLGAELMKTIAASCPQPPASLDKPLSKAQVLRLLKDRAPEPKIRELIEARGVEDFASDTASLLELKQAGATNSLIGRIANVDLLEGYVLAPAVRARDYDAASPHGRLEILAHVDQETVFRFQRNLLSYKVLKGKPPANPTGQYTQLLPRLPATEWEIKHQREKGRSKQVRVTAINPPPGGFAGLEISIDDDKGGADLYDIRVEWALKPFSPEGVRSAINETKDGSWENLIREVQFRGVSFELDSNLENSFRRAGAPSGLLRAIRSSKREDNF